MFLTVEDLKVRFPTRSGLVKAVDGLEFSLERGKVLAIVGESGSGKTAASLAILGLHGARAQISGRVSLDGREIVGAPEHVLRKLRGAQMSMIFQDPLTAMHPYYTVGDQLMEALRAHKTITRAAGRRRALEMLDLVGMADPQRCFASFPHQLSGGMRQRAMIALALICEPQLLIADEPTTALDVTIQAQILDLLKRLQKESNAAIIIITHDVGVVASLADEIVVMYGGKAVEQGSVRDVFYRPSHPYTWGLLGSAPRLDQPRERLLDIPGSPPSLANPPSGCVFHPRCAFTEYVIGASCTEDAPAMSPAGAHHAARCHLTPEQRVALWNEKVLPALTAAEPTEPARTRSLQP